MKKQCWFFIAGILLLPCLINAQDEWFTVLYTTSDADITYQKKAGEIQRVFAGKDLQPEGLLLIESDAWLNILYNGHKKRLDGPARLDLSDLALQMHEESKSSFLGRFMAFLSNSVRQTKDSRTMEKEHRQYLTNATAAIKGWGKKDFEIQVPFYLSGVFTDSLIRFYWVTDSSNLNYTFLIEDRESDKILFERISKESAVAVDLSKLSLAKQKGYYWSVETIGQSGTMLQSAPVPFLYDPGASNAFLKALREDYEYQKYDHFEAPLFELKSLEDSGFFQSAYNGYETLVREHPEVDLYRHVFAAFLIRMDALGEAQLVGKTGKNG